MFPLRMTGPANFASNWIKLHLHYESLFNDTTTHIKRILTLKFDT